MVVLSLVLNFVGDPIKRGQMLLAAHTLCKLQGNIFVSHSNRSSQVSNILIARNIVLILFDPPLEMRTLKNIEVPVVTACISTVVEVCCNCL